MHSRRKTASVLKRILYDDAVKNIMAYTDNCSNGIYKKKTFVADCT